MCKPCGSNVAPLRSLDNLDANQEITMQSLFDSGNYKLVRYVGRNFTATVGSPTGAIVQDGLRSYGRGKNGDYLLVHIKDIQAAPTMFTVLSKGTVQYQEALVKYDLKEKTVIAKEITSVASKAAIARAEGAVDTPVEEQLNPTDNKVQVNSENEMAVVENIVPVAKEDVTVKTTEVTKPKEEKPTKEELSDAGGRLLSKADALPLKEFQETYGYTHHMQVLSKVKSGELKSFKDEDDKTFVYHYDE